VASFAVLNAHGFIVPPPATAMATPPRQGQRSSSSPHLGKWFQKNRSSIEKNSKIGSAAPRELRSAVLAALRNDDDETLQNVNTLKRVPSRELVVPSVSATPETQKQTAKRLTDFLRSDGDKEKPHAMDEKHSLNSHSADHKADYNRNSGRLVKKMVNGVLVNDVEFDHSIEQESLRSRSSDQDEDEDDEFLMALGS
jgi:hypothetical protein